MGRYALSVARLTLARNVGRTTLDHGRVLENAMAFQPVPNCVEIDMIFTMNSITSQNVFYAEMAGGYLLGDLQALATQIDIQWQGTWRSEQPPEVDYVRTEVRGLAVINDLQASANANANPGINPSPVLPGNVTFAVKKESGLTGRSARGRTYWIGIPQNQITAADENQLAAAFIADLVTNVDSIRTAIAAVGTWLPVLVSRFTGGATRPFGVTFPWISTTNVGTRIDTQRRRLS